jgi:acyl carrier protein
MDLPPAVVMAAVGHYTGDMPEQLQGRIVGIIQKVSRQKVDVGPDESLFDSGLLDSFALPDMVSALEQEFGIAIPDSDLTPRKFESIASIERYVESRR